MKKKFSPEELKSKFVIASDTLLDGNVCMLDGDGNPELFNSEEEAFKEIFDSNASMLESHMEDEMLEEYNEGVTPELVAEMMKINISNDVAAMRKFMDEHPECDDSGEFVQPADEFIMNRKFIVGEKDGKLTSHIEGKKLTEL
jgi:hypothetical protein